jgi:hypothetical protein
MAESRKPWKDWTDDELADEAQTGTRGQGAAVESTRRLRIAIEASGDCASQQTAEVIKLTYALRMLTVVLIAIGILQLVAMLWPKGGV